MAGKKIRVSSLLELKAAKQKIVALTAYDYPTARAVAEAEVDVVLVGDSLGTVVLGYESTIPVTLEQMIHHTAAVRRAVGRPLLVADMPFMSYKVSVEQALTNAGRLMSEGGAEAVKLEGCEEVAPMIEALARAGIPVMGHLGLTPQSLHALSGYRVQGRGELEAQRLVHQARRLQELGCFAIVLELVAAGVSGEIGRALEVPTIGIGSGPDCDGQILVLHDMLGFTDRKTPSFVKRYAELHEVARDAVARYAAEVREGGYPDEEHCHR